jgi:predicted RNase H-like HicB family nuclease
VCYNLSAEKLTQGAAAMTMKVKTGSKSLKFQIRIIVETDDPGYHAYAPSLPGLHMPGDTQQEALDNAKEAAVLMLKCMIEDGTSIPIDVVIPEKKSVTVKVHDHTFSSLEDIEISF